MYLKGWLHLVRTLKPRGSCEKSSSEVLSRGNADNPGFVWRYKDEFNWEYVPVPEELNIPMYVRLDQLLPGERTGVLLASAALPFGIFPQVNIQGNNYVDGGVADNLPMYPIVTMEKCEEVVVIRLNKSSNLKDLLSHWQRVDRRIRVGGQSIVKNESRYLDYVDYGFRSVARSLSEGKRVIFDPPCIEPYESPSHWPARVILIEPPRSLGGLLTGTLNFGSRKARHLFWAGYHDACAALGKIQ